MVTPSPDYSKAGVLRDSPKTLPASGSLLRQAVIRERFVQESDLGSAALASDADFASASHEHSGDDLTSGTVATARLGSGTADGTTFLRGDQTWAAAGGGDGWTNVILGSDFTISTAADNAVTGLEFTPAADTTYLVEAFLLVQTTVTTVGPRPGFRWPTGLTDQGAYMWAPSSATASTQRNWGAATTVNTSSTGLPVINQSYLARGHALMIVGATPSGVFGATLRTETGGTSVTMKAGSMIRYKAIT